MCAIITKKLHSHSLEESPQNLFHLTMKKVKLSYHDEGKNKSAYAKIAKRIDYGDTTVLQLNLQTTVWSRRGGGGAEAGAKPGGHIWDKAHTHCPHA